MKRLSFRDRLAVLLLAVIDPNGLVNNEYSFDPDETTISFTVTEPPKCHCGYGAPTESGHWSDCPVVNR